MLYNTHKACGCLSMLIAYDVMSRCGMLLPDVHPLVQLGLMYTACSVGSTLPDIDLPHFKEQTPILKLLHKVLSLTELKHRSWQTHSVLVTGGFCVFLFAIVNLLNITTLGVIDVMILNLALTGLSVGILSHLFADMLSRQGIHLIPGQMIRLVPNTEFFSTGGVWEDFVRVFMYITIVVYVLYLVLVRGIIV